jgi:hypothetical protein
MAFESKDKSADKSTDNGDKLASNATAPGNAELQTTADLEVKQGYRGVEVDETPNEDLTVAGVLKAAKSAK